MRDPFRVRAFAAAAGFEKSTKQYPALLRAVSSVLGHHIINREVSLPGEFVSDHLDVYLFAHAKPYAPHEVLVDPWL